MLEVVVTDTEVEPLVVAARVRVHPHVQVVLPGLDAVDHVEVPRLKIGVKAEFLPVGQSRVHAFERPGRLSLDLLELCDLLLPRLGQYFSVFVGERQGKLKFVGGKRADVMLLGLLVRKRLVHFGGGRVAGTQIQGLDLLPTDRVVLQNPNHVEVVVERDGRAALNLFIWFPT